LCSENLDTPAIIDGTENFNTVLFSATAGSGASITGYGFAPDWVWTKARNTTQSHQLFDSVRGDNKIIYSNLTNTESAQSAGYFTLESDGFDYGTSTFSSNTYVGWGWLAGTAFSNDASATSVGTIDSSGQVNTTAGFSIVSYTGTGSAGTIKHGLSAAPEMLIVKNRDTARDWMVYHSALGATKRIWLNYTYGEDSGTAASATWNDTAPTSTVFSIGTNIHSNESGDDFICYAFHSVEGYSKVGSYTGNGNADGAFVYTGFRPAWVMIKRSDATDNWVMQDSARGAFNPDLGWLYADLTAAEETGSSRYCDFVSNGFKIRNSGTSTNASGGTYIYLAFAEAPFKFANAR
jgi:hypothetical protein